MDAAHLQSRRGDHGFDAPAWLIFLAGTGLAWIVIAGVLGLLVGTAGRSRPRSSPRTCFDWRSWYGGPWTATRLVTAIKPG